MRFDVLCGKSGHRCARAIVKPQAVHANEQSCVVVHFDDALNAPLVKFDVISRGNGHETVRQECDRIDSRQEFPFVPAIVVLRGCQSKGFLRLRQGKRVVSQFAGKMSRQDRVICLSNQDEMFALLLNDHCAGLVRSDGLYKYLGARGPGLTGDVPSFLLVNNSTIMPPPLSRIQNYRHRFTQNCEPRAAICVFLLPADALKILMEQHRRNR